MDPQTDAEQMAAGQSVCSWPGCREPLSEHGRESHEEEVRAARGLGVALILAIIFVAAAGTGLAAWAVIIEPALDRAGW